MLLDISIIELQNEFIAEASNDLDAAANCIATPEVIGLDIFQSLRRAMLAIKGGANFLELADIEAICTAAANVFSQADEIAHSKTLTSIQITNLIPAMNEFITSMRKLIVGDKNTAAPILAKLKLDLDIIKLELAKPQANTSAKSDGIYKIDVLSKAAAVDNEILTEVEFYTLLDELQHAVGSEVVVEIPAAPIAAEVALTVSKAPAVAVDDMLNNSILQQALVGEDFITELEFYALLDKLYQARNDEPAKPVMADPPAPAPQVLSGQIVNLHKMAATLDLIDEIVIENSAEVATVIKDIKTLVGDLQALQASMTVDNSKLISLMSAVVNSIAVELGKNVALEIHGEAVKLPTVIAEQLLEPLTHLLRNAVDHGIESNGTVSVTISENSQGYEITIADDGNGIDLSKIKQSAIKNNLVAADQIDSLSEQECLQLIFKPGISSKSEVSNTSGRGVGMDVVMNKITELKGKIQVGSVPNKGTQFIISIPRLQVP